LVNYSLGGISGDTQQHIVESKRVIKEKFTFLDDDEVDVISYIYYFWRDDLNHEKYDSLNMQETLLSLSIKYSFSPEFVKSIQHEENLNTQFKKNKIMLKLKNNIKYQLSKLPKMYKLTKSIYKYLKGNENGQNCISRSFLP